MNGLVFQPSACGRYFADKHGRISFLRGINLSGSVKCPKSPCQTSEIKEGMYAERKTISFVGRPFPLNEAHTHLRRLRRWGFTFLRFNVTWEAIEPHAPGEYDREYIQYVVDVLKVAKKYGFSVFLDPHQDVWSRFTGGSGAPGWTLEAVGFNLSTLHQSHAAFLHSHNPSETESTPMIWQTNYFKLACATMFTLFFGGNMYAPNCKLECKLPGFEMKSMPVQDWLQLHFTQAMLELTHAVAEAGLLGGHTTSAVNGGSESGERKHTQDPSAEASADSSGDGIVLGWDSMNEPSSGYLGMADLRGNTMPMQQLKLGLTPTAFQGMLLGHGMDFQAGTGIEVKQTHAVSVNGGDESGGDVNALDMPIIGRDKRLEAGAEERGDVGEGRCKNHNKKENALVVERWGLDPILNMAPVKRSTELIVGDAVITGAGAGADTSSAEARARSRAWQTGVRCLWAREGVWDDSTGELLQPDYFKYLRPIPPAASASASASASSFASSSVGAGDGDHLAAPLLQKSQGCFGATGKEGGPENMGERLSSTQAGASLSVSSGSSVTHAASVQREPLEFMRDCWMPFVFYYHQRIKSYYPNMMMFVDPPVGEKPPPISTVDRANSTLSSLIHDYDRRQNQSHTQSSSKGCFADVKSPLLGQQGQLSRPQHQQQRSVDSVSGLVFAPHWYDGITLISRQWNNFNINYLALNRGEKNALAAMGAPKKVFADMLCITRRDGLHSIGNVPCICGEVGIPYDLGGKEAYRKVAAMRAVQQKQQQKQKHQQQQQQEQQQQQKQKQKQEQEQEQEQGQKGGMSRQQAQVVRQELESFYDAQIRAYDANLSALEANFLNYTLWTYVSDHSHKLGDRWNGEDLSIYSLDDRLSEEVDAHLENDDEYNYNKYSRGFAAEVKSNGDREHAHGAKPEHARGGVLTSAGAGAGLNGGESVDTESFLDSGGRALPSLLRPVPETLARGAVPDKWSFEYRTKAFYLSVLTSSPLSSSSLSSRASAASRQSEIFLPEYHFPWSRRSEWLSRVEISGGGRWWVERRGIELFSPQQERKLLYPRGHPQTHTRTFDHQDEQRMGPSCVAGVAVDGVEVQLQAQGSSASPSASSSASLSASLSVAGAGERGQIVGVKTYLVWELDPSASSASAPRLHYLQITPASDQPSKANSSSDSNGSKRAKDCGVHGEESMTASFAGKTEHSSSSPLSYELVYTSPAHTSREKQGKPVQSLTLSSAPPPPLPSSSASAASAPVSASASFLSMADEELHQHSYEPPACICSSILGCFLSLCCCYWCTCMFKRKRAV